MRIRSAQSNAAVSVRVDSNQYAYAGSTRMSPMIVPMMIMSATAASNLQARRRCPSDRSRPHSIPLMMTAAMRKNTA